MTLDKQREVWYYNKALDSCITCGGVAHLGAPATACDDPSTRGNDNLIKTPETQ